MTEHLKVGILTTDTPHHRYFLRELDRMLPVGAAVTFVMFETKAYPWRRRARRHFWRSFPNLWRGVALNPYIQSSSLSRQQIEFERRTFFPNGDDALPDHYPVHTVYSVNDDQAAGIFDQQPCDLFYIYGTGIVRPHVFRRPRLGSINAHGGLLPGYRGLDTNLWAALAGRPEDMAVTIHQVDEELDTGAVVSQTRIGPIAGLDLVNFRYHTTMLVIQMTIDVLKAYVEQAITARKQIGENEYFGPMPMLLKRRAERAIRHYVATARIAEQDVMARSAQP